MCNIKNSTPVIKIHIMGVTTTEMGVATEWHHAKIMIIEFKNYTYQQ